MDFEPIVAILDKFNNLPKEYRALAITTAIILAITLVIFIGIKFTEIFLLLVGIVFFCALVSIVWIAVMEALD